MCETWTPEKAPQLAGSPQHAALESGNCSGLAWEGSAPTTLHKPRHAPHPWPEVRGQALHEKETVFWQRVPALPQHTVLLGGRTQTLETQGCPWGTSGRRGHPLLQVIREGKEVRRSRGREVLVCEAGCELALTGVSSPGRTPCATLLLLCRPPPRPPH